MKFIGSKDCCYICGTTYNLHTHHAFESSRKKACEQDGLMFRLCAYHHVLGDYSAHHSSELNLKLKQIAQREFEKTKTREEFIQKYRKNYL